LAFFFSCCVGVVKKKRLKIYVFILFHSPVGDVLDALQSKERGNTTERCKLTRNSMLTL
jgi:hypothetical protein